MCWIPSQAQRAEYARIHHINTSTQYMTAGEPIIISIKLCDENGTHRQPISACVVRMKYWRFNDWLLSPSSLWLSIVSIERMYMYVTPAEIDGTTTNTGTKSNLATVESRNERTATTRPGEKSDSDFWAFLLGKIRKSEENQNKNQLTNTSINLGVMGISTLVLHSTYVYQ